LVEKGSYVATVDVPFLLGAIVNAPLLKSKLEEKGFTNVSVAESKPAGFPLGGDADYYVTVSWNQNPKVFDVPSAVTAYRKVA
jgi:hypothetical protein